MHKPLPSPETIRAWQKQLQSGVTREEAEAIQELLQSAQQRVKAALPPDIDILLARLKNTPAQALECYALLQQPVKPKIKTPPDA